MKILEVGFLLFVFVLCGTLIYLEEREDEKRRERIRAARNNPQPLTLIIDGKEYRQVNFFPVFSSSRVVVVPAD